MKADHDNYKAATLYEDETIGERKKHSDETQGKR